MAGPETRLVNKIRAAIKQQWPLAVIEKLHGGPYQTAGLPDLLIIIEGRAIGIEVKAQRRAETYAAARARVTRLQQITLDQWREAGAGAFVALSAEEALNGVSEHLAR